MINILIVDDQKSVRARLEYLIQSIADFNVIGIAENGSDAIATVRVLQPDIVLLDMEMPELSGLMVIKLINKDFPNIKILVLSSHEKPEYVARSMSAGATGYLLKGSSDEEIEQAIRFVYRGCTHLGAGLLSKILPAVDSQLNNSTSVWNSLPIQEELQLPAASSSLAVVDADRDKCGSQKKQILAWLIITLSLTTGIYAFRQWLKKPLPTLSYSEQSATLANTKFQGKLQPAKTFKIATIAPGAIQEVHVEIGDRVEKGEALFTLKNLDAEAEKKQIIKEQQLTRQQQQIVLQQQQTAKQQLLELDRQVDRLKYNLAPLKAQIASANLRVSLAKARSEKLPIRQRQDSIPRTKALYDRAQASFNRFSKLHAQGAISLDKLEQAQSELDIAKVDYDMAIAASAVSTELAQTQQELSQLQERLVRQEQQDAIAELEKQKQTVSLQYQQATEKLALLKSQSVQLNKYQVPEVYKTIVATETGIVASLPVAAGEQIYSGNTVVTLAKLDRLKVEVAVNSRLIDALSPEQIAIVRLGSGVTARKFEGKIATVNPLPTEKLNYLVEVEFINATNSLLVGQLAQVQFMSQTIAEGE